MKKVQTIRVYEKMAKKSVPSLENRFHDNAALNGREDKFITVDALVAPVLASWRESIFAHEWLNQDGKIRNPSEMTETVKSRREDVEKLVESEESLERPVLGIGILDNIEIGAGKDLFLVLASKGIDKISVHIPKTHMEDFRLFIRQN